MSSTITAVILTYNEEKHIARCINSISGIVKTVIVVDSFSQDKTVEIAEKLGAKIFQNPWVNYASQFNWALSNCSINTDWVWRIDADEYANNKLIESLRKQLSNTKEEVTGIYVRRGIVFLGKQLKYGTWAPRLNLKIFRNNTGSCENRWMDEHIVLHHGETIEVEGWQIDDNLNGFTWWTDKHNHYATREMVDMLSLKYGLGTQNEVVSNIFGTSEQRMRWMKLRYANIPLFVRPFVNFVYRYILRFGFLDGKQGLIWHILQGFWYRFLVDAKIFELRRRFHHNDKEIIAYLKRTYGIN